MTRARTLRIGNRRRDAKVRFEILSEVVGSPASPPKTSAPPAARADEPRAPRKQTRPAARATGDKSHSDEQAHAVALRRTPRQFIYEWLVRRSSFGGTDEEIQAALHLDPGTARARRGELVRMKLVIDSGMKRKTRSGRPARVWVVANAGKPGASNP